MHCLSSQSGFMFPRPLGGEEAMNKLLLAAVDAHCIGSLR
jgi:hypothetical protein